MMRKGRRLCQLAAVAIGLLGLALSAAAEVRLQLDRTRLTEGETVTLTFLTQDPRQKLDADFSELERDFEILDQRTETQLSIVNGRQAAVVRLMLTLEPRRAGDLTIPSIDFGGAFTQPVSLRVDEAPELEPGQLPPVFIEVEITPEQGPYYVHAQLGLIVRVFYQQNLTEAAISQPEPSPAAVRLLQETPYQAERSGERYRVLERRYAVFPERSGELLFPPMQLSGRLVERRDGSIWQPTVRGRRVTVESEPLQLQIEPRPQEFTGSDWQPARNLNLSQQISSTETLRVGEPVTRTIIIDAVGLEENMIAEPAWPDLPGARIYPDQPQGITRDDGEWVLGHKEFRYAVVPEEPGELVLPALRVQWWDTENDRQRTAVLPAQVLSVQPSALVPPPEPPPAADPEITRTAEAGEYQPVDQPPFWRWLTLVFAALWLLTLFGAWWLWKRAARPRPQTLAEQAAEAGEAQLLRGLRRACEGDDLSAARHNLVAWIRRFGPAGSGSLFEFAANCGDPSLRDAIYAMDAQGFRRIAEEDGESPSATKWNGRSFRDDFEAWRQSWRAERRHRHASPADLYAPANRSV